MLLQRRTSTPLLSVRWALLVCQGSHPSMHLAQELVITETVARTCRHPTCSTTCSKRTRPVPPTLPSPRRSTSCTPHYPTLALRVICPILKDEYRLTSTACLSPARDALLPQRFTHPRRAICSRLMVWNSQVPEEPRRTRRIQRGRRLRYLRLRICKTAWRRSTTCCRADLRRQYRWPRWITRHIRGGR